MNHYSFAGQTNRSCFNMEHVTTENTAASILDKVFAPGFKMIKCTRIVPSFLKFIGIPLNSNISDVKCSRARKGSGKNKANKTSDGHFSKNSADTECDISLMIPSLEGDRQRVLRDESYFPRTETLVFTEEDLTEGKEAWTLFKADKVKMRSQDCLNNSNEAFKDVDTETAKSGNSRVKSEQCSETKIGELHSGDDSSVKKDCSRTSENFTPGIVATGFDYTFRSGRESDVSLSPVGNRSDEIDGSDEAVNSHKKRSDGRAKRSASKSTRKEHAVETGIDSKKCSVHSMQKSCLEDIKARNSDTKRGVQSKGCKKTSPTEKNTSHSINKKYNRLDKEKPKQIVKCESDKKKKRRNERYTQDKEPTKHDIKESPKNETSINKNVKKDKSAIYEVEKHSVKCMKVYEYELSKESSVPEKEEGHRLHKGSLQKVHEKVQVKGHCEVEKVKQEDSNEADKLPKQIKQESNERLKLSEQESNERLKLAVTQSLVTLCEKLSENISAKKEHLRIQPDQNKCSDLRNKTRKETEVSKSGKTIYQDKSAKSRPVPDFEFVKRQFKNLSKEVAIKNALIKSPDKDHNHNSTIDKQLSNKLECTICNQIPFKSQANLDEHVLSTHTSNNQPLVYKCDSCDLCTFPDKELLERHRFYCKKLFQGRDELIDTRMSEVAEKSDANPKLPDTEGRTKTRKSKGILVNKDKEETQKSDSTRISPKSTPESPLTSDKHTKHHSLRSNKEKRDGQRHSSKRALSYEKCIEHLFADNHDLGDHVAKCEGKEAMEGSEAKLKHPCRKMKVKNCKKEKISDNSPLQIHTDTKKPVVNKETKCSKSECEPGLNVKSEDLFHTNKHENKQNDVKKGVSVFDKKESPQRKKNENSPVDQTCPENNKKRKGESAETAADNKRSKIVFRCEMCHKSHYKTKEQLKDHQTHRCVKRDLFAKTNNDLGQNNKKAKIVTEFRQTQGDLHTKRKHRQLETGVKDKKQKLHLKCRVCKKENFETEQDLEDHLVRTHVSSKTVSASLEKSSKMLQKINDSPKANKPLKDKNNPSEEKEGVTAHIDSNNQTENNTTLDNSRDENKENTDKKKLRVKNHADKELKLFLSNPENIKLLSMQLEESKVEKHRSKPRCPQCKTKYFTTTERLQLHMQLVHGTDYTDSKRLENLPEYDQATVIDAGQGGNQSKADERNFKQSIHESNQREDPAENKVKTKDNIALNNNSSDGKLTSRRKVDEMKSPKVQRERNENNEVSERPTSKKDEKVYTSRIPLLGKSQSEKFPSKSVSNNRKTTRENIRDVEYLWQIPLPGEHQNENYSSEGYKTDGCGKTIQRQLIHKCVSSEYIFDDGKNNRIRNDHVNLSDNFDKHCPTSNLPQLKDTQKLKIAPKETSRNSQKISSKQESDDKDEFSDMDLDDSIDYSTTIITNERVYGSDMFNRREHVHQMPLMAIFKCA